MDQQPFHVTFYSFRGGTDRTSALVNVGFELARRGRKVLLVDFDLEAPALAALPSLRSKESRPGLVEYVTEFLDTNQSPPISDYLYRARSVGQKGGEVWVMPSGREDSDYWASLGRLDWSELYRLHMGFVFFEDMREQWRQTVRPDYVLVNAPAGINDLTGVCTRQFPDLVVALAEPSGSDQAGLQLVHADVQAEEKQENAREIALALAVVGLPNLPDTLPRRFRQSVAEALGCDAVDVLIHRDDRPLPHEAQPVVLGEPRSRLAREYRRLARVCLKKNAENDRDGALLFLKELERGDPLRVIDFPVLHGYSNAARRLEDILLKFYGDEEIVLKGTHCLFNAYRYEPAMSALDRALEEQPDSGKLLFHRANYQTRLKYPPEQAIRDLRQLLVHPSLTPEPANEALLLLALELLSRLSLEEYEITSKILRERILGAPGSPPKQIDSKQELILRVLPFFKTDVNGRTDPDVLLKAHRWQEAIAILDPIVNGPTPCRAWDIFLLAVATWGATGKLSEDLCKRGVIRFHEHPSEERGRFTTPSDLQLLSLIFWGAGESKNALDFLNQATNLARRQSDSTEGEETREFESLWQKSSVSLEQFQEDCRKQGRMIKGEISIPSPFQEQKTAV